MGLVRKEDGIDLESQALATCASKPPNQAEQNFPMWQVRLNCGLYQGDRSGQLLREVQLHRYRGRHL